VRPITQMSKKQRCCGSGRQSPVCSTVSKEPFATMDLQSDYAETCPEASRWTDRRKSNPRSRPLGSLISSRPAGSRRRRVHARALARGTRARQLECSHQRFGGRVALETAVRELFHAPGRARLNASWYSRAISVLRAHGLGMTARTPSTGQRPQRLGHLGGAGVDGEEGGPDTG
jgi:hypothetical protein